MSQTQCKAPGCESTKLHRRGECVAHYRRMNKYGDYETVGTPGPKPDPTKWRSRHNPDNPSRTAEPRPRQEVTHCPHGHEYTEENTYVYLTKEGYDNRQCRACHRENKRARDALSPGPGQGSHNANKTHCPQGHEYTEENTYLWNGKRRACRACQRTTRHEKTIPKQYGITHEDYLAMLESQEGRCAVCRDPFGDKRPHIDHDHRCCSGRYTCGKCVRGLLCGDCNTGLGKLKDSADVLLAAVQYLTDGQFQAVVTSSDRGVYADTHPSTETS